MKVKAILFALALCLAATAVVSAKTSPHMGTWNINLKRSHFAKGAAKNTKVVYEAAGDDIKVTVDGVDGAGAATHNEWTGKFDGNFFPVTGDPTSDERSYKVVNWRTLKLTGRKDSKVTINGTIMVSANGKTRTVTTSGLDAKGKRFRTVAVYDKE